MEHHKMRLRVTKLKINDVIDHTKRVTEVKQRRLLVLVGWTMGVRGGGTDKYHPLKKLNIRRPPLGWPRRKKLDNMDNMLEVKADLCESYQTEVEEVQEELLTIQAKMDDIVDRLNVALTRHGAVIGPFHKKFKSVQSSISNAEGRAWSLASDLGDASDDINLELEGEE